MKIVKMIREFFFKWNGSSKIMQNVISTADNVQSFDPGFWYNGASNGKGAKVGTNEALIIWINNQIVGILKL